ncbi:MAG TPA: SirB2 family protein [Burkholderiales bacterium]|nr:SirB2 family protein [Betaproteobacteria bacterium]HQR53961.1 SirB2 family protein [Burkholderiales bacterium]
MTYTLLKNVHVGCVAITIVLFVVRGVWMIRGTLRNRGRWARVAPHVVDTVLLASAIAMAVMLGAYPGTAGWLTAKVIGLFVYILLGTVALKRGRTLQMRIAAFAGALVSFSYVVSVALTHDPRGFLAL